MEGSLFGARPRSRSGAPFRWQRFSMGAVGLVAGVLTVAKSLVPLARSRYS
jgi:hypothetical protein